MQPEWDAWLQFAADDLLMAQLAQHAELWNQACFHAQQSCEKLLKALLIFHNTLPPRTHKMADLLSHLKCEPPDSLNEKMLLLDRFYIPTRYPDAMPGALKEGMPDDKDALEAIETAVACKSWVNSIITH